MSRSWDVFCRVVDNFGDAAVCWRLARQLAGEHGGRVRLWIDELPALHALCPEVVEGRSLQVVSGVEVREWASESEFGAPAQIVIEAFGGGLPQSYVESMVECDPHPVWIILEYLSAEPWIATHHGLASPHPRLPLERHFFFPGIGAGTGGVLREASLEPRRLAFGNSPDTRARFWRGIGFQLPPAEALIVSLFGYENPAAGAMLQMWAERSKPMIVAVPRSRLRAGVCDFFAAADPGDGATLRKGNLEARFLPFLPQPAYDELLWACEWNFVRGEDSFVRAQWARRPMVWQIYPQQDRIHEPKLDAFLDAYCAGLESGPKDALCSLWHAWNSPEKPEAEALRAAWEALDARRELLRAHAAAWAAQLAQLGDLAGNLAQYCEERLK